MDIIKKLIVDEELKKEFEIILPKELINSLVDKEALKVQKNYKLDGFRLGKVPIDMIKSREKEALFFRTTEDLINSTVADLAKENNYNLVLSPNVNIKAIEDGKNVEFTVIFELKPTIPDIDLKSIKLDYHKINVGEEDTKEAEENLLKMHKKWVEKDETAELNDSVEIDFVGKIDGSEFEGGKSENYQLELGSHSFIDNFEEQLVGKNKGDEVNVNVTFPENYHKSSLAGKPAVFEVKINKVLKSEKQDLSDEFVNEYFGVESVDKFRKAIKQELETSYTNLSRENLKDKAIEEIKSIVNFNIPEGLIKEHFNKMKTNEEKLNLRKEIKEPINEEKIKKDAEEAAKIGLILGEIANKENLVVSDNELTEEIMKSATSMPGYEKMVIDFYKKNGDALDSLRNQVLERKILDFIIDNIEKNEIPISIEEYKKMKELK